MNPAGEASTAEGSALSLEQRSLWVASVVPVEVMQNPVAASVLFQLKDSPPVIAASRVSRPIKKPVAAFNDFPFCIVPHLVTCAEGMDTLIMLGRKRS